MHIKRHRVFIAIPCKKPVLDLIVEYQKKWNKLPVRWIKPKNLHLTLVPPAYFSDDEIVQIIARLKQVIAGILPFNISFDSFIFAPPGKPSRMIWLTGPKDPRLQHLKDTIEDAMGVKKQSRPIFPHITVARMPKNEWKKYGSESNKEEKVKVAMLVEEIAVMESILSKTGADYFILETIPFKKNQ